MLLLISLPVILRITSRIWECFRATIRKQQQIGLYANELEDVLTLTVVTTPE